MLSPRIIHRFKYFVAPFMAYHALVILVVMIWAGTVALVKALGVDVPRGSAVDWALIYAWSAVATVYMIMMVIDCAFPRHQEAPLLERPWEWLHRRAILGLHIAQSAIFLSLAASLWPVYPLAAIGFVIAVAVEWICRGNPLTYYRM